MRLLELFEQAGKTAAVAFGRMNPPTIGHQKVVAAILKQKADAHFLFVSQTHKPTGKNKTRLENPLPFDVKLGFIQQAFPNIDIGDTSVGTAIGILQNLEKQGFENVIFVCGSDRVAAFTELFNKQNGIDYNLKSIKIESSGGRDPDAEGAEGMSASKMRAAAIADDFDAFKTGLPAGLQGNADEVFSAVRQGLEPWLEQGVAEDSKEGAYPKYSQGHNDAMNNKPSIHKTLTGNDRHNYVSGYKDGLIDRKKHHGVAEGSVDKKPYPKTWHDVDPKIGKLVDKMSPEEKVKKGYANPSILKKKKEQGVAEAYPKQQAARYNPNGTTYKGSANKMPTLDPNDPAHNADRYGAAYDEPYEMDFDKEDLKRAIAKGMSDLSDREKQILKLRFWEDMTYEEVASELGVTRERIRQIEARALRQLKHPTRSDRLRPFVHPEIKG